MKERVRIPLKGDKAIIMKDLDMVVKEDDDSGNIIALISTDSVDSDNDVIHQGENENGKGWNLERFNKHPVMLWSHNPYQPSLGGGFAWVTGSDLGKGLHFTPHFDTGDEFAMLLEGKIRRKVIQETSVGFVSDNFTRRKAEEDTGWPGYDFWDSELMEVSWVNRGAQPDVETAVKGMLLRSPDLVKEIEDFDDRFLKLIKGEMIDRFNELTTRIKTLEDYIEASQNDARRKIIEDAGKIDEVVNSLIDRFKKVL
jgi:hypothetical protein